MHLSAPPAPAQQVCQAPALLLISPALLCIRELGPHAAQKCICAPEPSPGRRSPRTGCQLRLRVGRLHGRADKRNPLVARRDVVTVRAAEHIHVRLAVHLRAGGDAAARRRLRAVRAHGMAWTKGPGSTVYNFPFSTPVFFRETGATWAHLCALGMSQGCY